MKPLISRRHPEIMDFKSLQAISLAFILFVTVVCGSMLAIGVIFMEIEDLAPNFFLPCLTLYTVSAFFLLLGY